MKIIVFLVSLAIFVAGLYLMGQAFSVVGWEAVVFTAGILATAISIMIPVHLLKRVDG